MDTFLGFEETEHSKIFPNEAFGHEKITVERPLRLTVNLTDPTLNGFRETCAQQGEEALAGLVDALAATLGPGSHTDYNAFLEAVTDTAKSRGVRLTAGRKKLLQNSLAERDETAEPVVKKFHRLGRVETAPLHGRHEVYAGGELCVAEYEPDPDLRDTEEVPLLEEGGVEAFFKREVLPHTPDAWIDNSKTRIGYEINFNRHFYRPKPLRSLEEIRSDIDALEKETEGLLEQILVEVEGER